MKGIMAPCNFSTSLEPSGAVQTRILDSELVTADTVDPDHCFKTVIVLEIRTGSGAAGD